MSKKNPTWLDEYYLIVRKEPSDDLRRIIGANSLMATEARELVIKTLNGPDTVLVGEKCWPRSGDVVRTFLCHSEETWWVRVTINFTMKTATGGDKWCAFVERIQVGEKPEIPVAEAG